MPHILKMILSKLKKKFDTFFKFMNKIAFKFILFCFRYEEFVDTWDYHDKRMRKKVKRIQREHKREQLETSKEE